MTLGFRERSLGARRRDQGPFRVVGRVGDEVCGPSPNDNRTPDGQSRVQAVTREPAPPPVPSLNGPRRPRRLGDFRPRRGTPKEVPGVLPAHGTLTCLTRRPHGEGSPGGSSRWSEGWSPSRRSGPEVPSTLDSRGVRSGEGRIHPSSPQGGRRSDRHGLFGPSSEGGGGRVDYPWSTVLQISRGPLAAFVPFTHPPVLRS